MKTESEDLSARQSLDIITTMIQQAKGKAQANSFYFLFWGWVVALAQIGMYILMLVNYSRPYAIWLIAVPAWIFTLYKGFRDDRSEKTAPTHFDRITTSLWLSFGIVIFTMVAFGYTINFRLNPVILTISAMPTFVSGVIIRFRPLIAGGISLWIFGVACFLLPYEIQPLMGASAIICGYLIPGYILKSRKG